MAIRRGRSDGDQTPSDAEVEVDEGADAAVEADGAEREPREPIFAGVRALLVPTIAVLLVGLITVVALVGAFRSFRMHEAKVAVQGEPATVEFFQQQLGSGDDPLFDIVPVPAGESASTAVQKRQVYATLVLSANAWQLQYAGANGTIINSQLQGTFQPDNTGRTGKNLIQYSTTDVAPAAKGDRSGWSVFFLTVGVVLAAFAFGLVVGFRRERLPARAERVALGVFALGLGVLSTLIVRFGFDALSGSPFLPCLFQTLLAFSVAALTVAAIRVGRIYGAALAAVVFVALGIAFSGALLPPPFLVASLQWVVNVLPPGMAAQGTTGAAYFDGASFGVALYGLVAWTIVAVIALVLVDRFRPAPAVDDDVVAA